MTMNHCHAALLLIVMQLSYSSGRLQSQRGQPATLLLVESAGNEAGYCTICPREGDFAAVSWWRVSVRVYKTLNPKP